MTVKELIQILNRVENKEDRVLIATSDPYHFGPKPGVNIAHTYDGFDWDQGNFYIVGNMDIYTKPTPTPTKEER